MDDYVITTADVRERFTDWYNGPKAPPLHEAQAEFDRWLNEVKAIAWAEGFDAGEKDIWQHEHSEDGWDADCVNNPYLEGDHK